MPGVLRQEGGGVGWRGARPGRLKIIQEVARVVAPPVSPGQTGTDSTRGGRADYRGADCGGDVVWSSVQVSSALRLKLCICTPAPS